MQPHLDADFLSPVIMVVFPPPGMGEGKGKTFTMGNVCPAFRQIGGGRRALSVFPTS